MNDLIIFAVKLYLSPSFLALICVPQRNIFSSRQLLWICVKFCSWFPCPTQHMFYRILLAQKLDPIRNLDYLLVQQSFLVFYQQKAMVPSIMGSYKQWCIEHNLSYPQKVQPSWPILQVQHFSKTIWHMVLEVLYRRWNIKKYLQPKQPFVFVGMQCWLFLWQFIQDFLEAQGLWL